MSKRTTYEVKVICINCGYSGQVTILNGVPTQNHKCPHCECANHLFRVSEEEE